MTQLEALTVMRRMLALYPMLVDDEGRQRAILREIEKFAPAVVEHALTEYMTLGEKFLNPGQLCAIANRIHQQQRERESFNDRQRQREAERAEANELASDLKLADERIAQMSDEEIDAIWQPIFAQFTGKVREWAEHWTREQIRGNRQVRRRVAEQIRDERAVAEMA